MRTFIAFTKKEFLEQVRTNKLLILTLVFIFIGILNPLTALLTPWILEMFSESMEGSGVIIGEIEVTALDSWMQFYKNIPIAFIVFLLVQSSIFSKEYQKGTLTLVLTKGFERYKIIISKFLTIISLWTIGYWLCFIITYSYNIYYWDNSIVSNLLFSGVCWYLLGIFILSLFTLFSVLSNSNSISLTLTGIVVFTLYMIGLIPKIAKYVPTVLGDGNSLIYGIEEASYYLPGVIISIFISILLLLVSILIFNKKKL